jgi:hypothetical protein
MHQQQYHILAMIHELKFSFVWTKAISNLKSGWFLALNGIDNIETIQARIRFKVKGRLAALCGCQVEKLGKNYLVWQFGVLKWPNN